MKRAEGELLEFFKTCEYGTAFLLPVAGELVQGRGAFPHPAAEVVREAPDIATGLAAAFRQHATRPGAGHPPFCYVGFYGNMRIFTYIDRKSQSSPPDRAAILGGIKAFNDALTRVPHRAAVAIANDVMGEEIVSELADLSALKDAPVFYAAAPVKTLASLMPEPRPSRPQVKAAEPVATVETLETLRGLPPSPPSAPPKRGRGRPRKTPLETKVADR